MNVRTRTGKTYTQYQLEKILDKAEADYERQWNEKLEEIREQTFEQVKLDIWSQLMSIAMATLEQFHGFTEEQTAEFYKNCISLMELMKNEPLGKEFTPQDTINHVKETTGIDLDKDLTS